MQNTHIAVVTLLLVSLIGVSVSFCDDCSATEAGTLLSFSFSAASSSQKRSGDRPNYSNNRKEGNTEKYLVKHMPGFQV